MKIKCDKFILPNGRKDCFHRLNGTCLEIACHMGEILNIEISTASLIAELEARRKCKDCGFGENGYECNKCIWEKRIDNFTPTSKKESK